MKRLLPLLARAAAIVSMILVAAIPGMSFADDFSEVKAKAERGDASAQCNLGFAYANGELVPKDAVEAVRWWRKAAEQGNVYALSNLGAAYANGEGVPKDAVESV